MIVFGILDRYIARTVLRTTVLTTLALAFLLVFFTFADELGDVQQGQYQITDAFQVALLSAPHHLFDIFPVAALIGGLLGLGHLAGHSELIAMRAGGFALRHIVYAVLKAGLLMLPLVVLIAEWLAPVSAQYAQQLRLKQKTDQVVSASEYGFWVRDDNQFVNIERIVSTHRLQGVTLYRFDVDGDLVLTSQAESADYQDGYWLLQNLQQSLLHPNQIQTENQPQMRWDSILNPALLSVVVVQPDKLSTRDLYRYLRFMQDSQQDAISYQVAFWSRIMVPILALLMLLLAIPFALVRQRSGTGQRIFIGAMLGALFFLLMRAIAYAAVVYHLNPLVMMAVPVALCLVMIFGLLRYVR